MSAKQYIGVDIHSDNFTACFLCEDRVVKKEKYDISSTGFKEFLSNVSPIDEIALEATHNSSFFYDTVASKVFKVTLISPADFIIIAKSTKKSDVIDAYHMAYFLSKDMLPSARKKERIYQHVASLIDTRLLYVRSRVSYMHKVAAIVNRHGIKVASWRIKTKSGFAKHIYCHDWDKLVIQELKSLEGEIKHLSETIEEIEKNIDECCLNLRGYESLQTISGIGPLSAAILLSVIGNIDDFPNPSKLASYFGVVPRLRESNAIRQKCGITRKGSKIGRSTLIQCTWVAIKFSPYLRKYYERLKKTKSPSKAIVPTSRKLLHAVYNTLKNDWVFDDFTKYKYHVVTKETIPNT